MFLMIVECVGEFWGCAFVGIFGETNSFNVW